MHKFLKQKMLFCGKIRLNMLPIILFCIASIYAAGQEAPSFPDTIRPFLQDTSLYAGPYFPARSSSADMEVTCVRKISEEDAPPSVALVTSAEALCTANPFFAFWAEYTDDGTIGIKKSFIYEYSVDETTWTSICTSSGSYTQRPGNLQEGWYRVSMARTDEIDMPDRWIVSEPVYLQKVDGGCTPFAHPWPDEISENVCPRGTLLFREDFGGNDPSDPVTSQEALTPFSSRYRQAFDVMTRVSSGLFIIAKRGWQNNLNTNPTANLYSQWFIQDDHTYPNDYTRGYLLAVDGIGGNAAFYSTTFPVCHEMDLSFSAYVANVLEPGHNFARPKVRFLIQNELTGDTILEQSSGPIKPAPNDYAVNGSPLVQSAPWHLVGASFHVPEEVSILRLSIFNDENATTGNDFAMDDIEIRLCEPMVTINSANTACLDMPYTFDATVMENSGFRQPYGYLWQFAKDSLPYDSDGWTDLHLGSDLTLDKMTKDNEGWYRLCITSNGVDISTELHCRVMSDPFHLTAEDCTPPCPDWAVEIMDTLVCDTLLPFRWHDTIFAEASTIEIIYKNEYDCDIKKGIYTLQTETCCPDLKYNKRDTAVCDTLLPFTWQGLVFNVPGAQTTVTQDSRGCDSLLTTWTLSAITCCPTTKSLRRDTTVCDTILPFTWQGIAFDTPGSQTTVTQDSRGCDSLLTTWTLSTATCCYDLQYAPHDTAVCDTLLPFTWHGVLFREPAGHEVIEYSLRGCDSILHTYVLDTFHCERLYPIIVNKYNWQLLCDNVALRRLFPTQSALAFQWYKNDAPVQGAVEDDYAEQDELHGKFQLYVTLTGNGHIWSNIIELSDAPESMPADVRIYNSRGIPVSEDRITGGVYLFRYEQGGRVWTEKKLIP